jgi:hypothetical protein
MYTLLFTAAVLLPGLKPVAKCPRPVLVNIDLKHKIDRLVFKRTFMKCRRQYKKSPCLVKLAQPEKGAFHAICGEVREGLENGIELKPDTSLENDDLTTFEPNCSSEIFANALAADWANFQNYPVVTETKITFCESLEIKSK